MPRILFLAAGFLAAFAFGVIVRESQTGESRIESSIVPPAILPDAAVALEEIGRLRKEHGSALEGTLLAETSSETGFRAAVASVSGLEIEPLTIAPTEPNQTAIGEEQGAVAALRHHAEEIEKIAAQCERERRFLEADTLRETVAVMRKAARNLETSVTDAPK